MASIRKRGNSYEIRVSNGYKADGSPNYSQMTWSIPSGMSVKAAEKEAQKQAILFEEKIKTGSFMPSSVRLSDFAARWFDEYAVHNLKPSTVNHYHNLWPRCEQALGRMRLDRIRPQHLIKFYANLNESGIRRDQLFVSKIDFKDMLHARGMTAESFSKNAGVGVRTVYAIYAGGRVRLCTCEKICTALSLTIDDVFSPVNPEQRLSGSTVRHYHKFLSTMFKSAVEWQILAINPCDSVKAPQAQQKDPRYLDEKSAIKLIESLQDEPVPYRTMIILMLDTGLRRGELCGLEWKDFDFEKHTVYIQRNSVYVSGQGVIDETPKTRKAKRIIKLPEETIHMLKQYRAWQMQERLKLGDQWKEYDRLFTQWNGCPIHPQTITGWFRKFISRNDLPPISVHSLRHTNASLLIAAGTNIRTVSSRLGHAQTSTTMDIYTHAIQSADAVAADTIGAILHQGRQKKKKA